MGKDTTIKLKQGFVDWLKDIGKKGDSYQDILLEIIFKTDPERIEELLKQNAYDFHALAKRLGVKFRDEYK